ncbi:MAG: sodium/proton-translocating pyrophosphatase, partial [Gemmatimonadota bacterium]|nr:sodium/proton-translocating pyrophosphatase [Gemmatimonadota bacterium]
MNLTNWAWALGLFGLGTAGFMYAYVTRQPAGNETMRDIADQIHDGAMAFLRREYSVLAGFIVVVAALLFLAIGQSTAVAYVVGALFSVMAGFFGMKAATRANVRTTAAAL